METLIVGCGYLGQRVGRLLVERGERVSGTVRSAARAARLEPLGIVPLVADVLDLGSLERLPATERTLYCVGFDRTAGVPIRTVYLDGLRNYLRSVSGRASRFVYASTTGVYGQTDGAWVTEDCPTVPPHESGQVCLEAERLVQSRALERGMTSAILRFSGLYGPGRLPRRGSLALGEPIPGDPDAFLNLVHIDDAARAAVAALDSGKSNGVYNVCDDRPIARREYCELVAALLGFPNPRFETRSASAPGAGREGMNKRVSNARLRDELGIVPAYPDITTGVPASLHAEGEAQAATGLPDGRT